MGHPDFPAHLTDKMPIESALKVMDFVCIRSEWVRHFGIVEFAASETLLGWFLTRSFIKPRELGWPTERPISNPIAPIKLMAMIYEGWKEAYPEEDSADAWLLQGKNWLDYQREVKRLIPPPPSMRADREFLRFCLTYIARQYDWIDEDYEIRFSRVPGLLRIVAKDLELFCPARGDWLGEVIVSAKALFRGIPMRFMGSFVALEAYGDKLGIAGYRIDSRWEDQPRVAKEEYQ